LQHRHFLRCGATFTSTSGASLVKKIVEDWYYRNTLRLLVHNQLRSRSRSSPGSNDVASIHMWSKDERRRGGKLKLKSQCARQVQDSTHYHKFTNAFLMVQGIMLPGHRTPIKCTTTAFHRSGTVWRQSCQVASTLQKKTIRNQQTGNKDGVQNSSHRDSNFLYSVLKEACRLSDCSCYGSIDVAWQCSSSSSRTTAAHYARPFGRFRRKFEPPGH
jgi:hypothetical protein